MRRRPDLARWTTHGALLLAAEWGGCGAVAVAFHPDAERVGAALCYLGGLGLARVGCARLGALDRVPVWRGERRRARRRGVGLVASGSILAAAPLLASLV